MKILTSGLTTEVFNFQSCYSYIFQTPLHQIQKDTSFIIKYLENIKPDHVEIIIKAFPLLLPNIIEHHSPKLSDFIKPGLEIQLQDLSDILNGLKGWHSFIETVKFKTEKVEKLQKLPKAVFNIMYLLLEKNTRLMSQIFQLMIEAKKSSKDSVTLTSEDIQEFDSNIVSPRNVYLSLTS